MDDFVLNAKKILVFDTETTGFPDGKVPPYHPKQPYMVQLGCTLIDCNGDELSFIDKILKWDITISEKMYEIHGVSTDIMNEKGEDPKEVMEIYNDMLEQCDLLVAHNEPFDTKIENITRARLKMDARKNIKTFCTMEYSKQKLKLPKFNLQATHQFLIGVGFDKAHRAIHDARATGRVFIEMLNRANSGQTTELFPSANLSKGKKQPSKKENIDNPFDV